MSPAVWPAARRVRRMVSAMDSLMGAMPGGQGCPPRVGRGASLSGMLICPEFSGQRICS